MIDRLITFALKQRLLILLAVAILIGGGILAFARLPIDAFPDVTNIQVQVITKAPGMSPVEVEQLVTFPLEVDLMGLPKKTELRSISKFGISVITVSSRRSGARPSFSGTWPRSDSGRGPGTAGSRTKPKAKRSKAWC